MISITEVLAQNYAEAVEILKKKGEVIFAEWDDNEKVYSNADDCPYIRYANDEEMRAELVVGVRYNDKSQRIEIITTNSEYEETDEKWFPIKWADDISYWYVLEYLENYC